MSELDDPRTDLIGTYRLVSVEHVSGTGEVGHPFGEHPVGYMTYSAEGYMSVIMARADRPRFAGGDILAGTAEEQADAFGTASAFVGRFELVDGGKVRYQLEVATYPNWVGTTQERQIELGADGRLVLTTPVLLMAGEPRWARVVLQRIAADDGG